MSTDCSLLELRIAPGVTHIGYHVWARRVPGQRAQANAALLPLIAQAHQEKADRLATAGLGLEHFLFR